MCKSMVPATPMSARVQRSGTQDDRIAPSTQQHGAHAMKSIDENQLEEFAANNAVKQFIFREAEDQRFCLVVVLTWKEGENVLFTARKQMRLWPNLNTLAGFVRGLRCLNTPITLELDYANPQTDK
ncbi:hypothetical protein CXB34_28140 [Pseudomonas amygdali pv. morsprunorum]|nr:hypothetical protein CXB34_28140 [Pseudomonas amygdali pv. morsprunorum]